MFKLLRYFSITSLLAFIIVIALLGIFYRQTAVNDLIELEERKNVALTRAFANSLWPQFVPFITSVSGLGADELRAHPETARLRQAVEAQMKDLSVVRVKIYNLEGITVFSTEADQIGEDQSTNIGFLSARSGQVASELNHRDTLNVYDNIIEDRDVVSSYLPLRSGDPAGPVEGVFEVDGDVTPLLHSIEHTQRNIMAGTALILGSLYIILFFIVRRADGIIQHQHAECKQTEATLRESEARLRSLIVSSLDGILAYDKDIRYTHWNPAMERISGVKQEELLGKTPFEVFPFLDEVGEGDAFREAVKGKAMVKSEMPYNVPETGRSGYFESSHFPLYDAGGNVIGGMGIIRDITEHKRAKTAEKLHQEALQAAEAKYRSLVEQLPAITYIVTFGQVNRTTYISPQIEALLGFSQAEWLADKDLWIKQLHPDDRERVLAEVRRKDVNRESLDIEYRVLARDGRVLWFRNQNVLMLDETGQIRYSHGVMLDITKRKKVERERTRLLVAEREQRLLAETLSEVTLALTAQTSHEAVLDEILRQGQRIVPYSAATIMLLEKDALRIARWQGYEAFGIEEMAAKLVLSLADFPLDAEVVQSRKLLVISDTYQEPRWVVLDEAAWVRSHLIMPICQRDRVLGLLRLDSENPGQFSVEDAQRLQPLANAAAIALENARLYEQTRQDAETKAVLLREVNHRVNNNLAAIIGLLGIEQRRTGVDDQATYQAIMEDLINRIRGLAAAHRLLAAAEWSPLPLSELAGQVIGSVLRALPLDKRVHADVAPSPVRVTPKVANNLALVINELATNAVKYAWPADQTGHIAVRIDREDDLVLFEFRDDGSGYPEEVLRLERHNVGWDLIQTIIGHGLQGEVTLHNDQGAVTIIRFPAPI